MKLNISRHNYSNSFLSQRISVKVETHNLPWSEDDDQLLRNLWNQQVELPVYISKLHRTEPSIKLRLKYLGIVDLTKTTKGSLTPQGPQRGNLPWDDHEDEILINLYEEGIDYIKDE